MSDKEAAEIIAKLVMAKPRAAIAYLREEVLAAAREEGRAAGIEEAIKGASEITDSFGHRGLSDLIRALAPAATTEEPK